MLFDKSSALAMLNQTFSGDSAGKIGEAPDRAEPIKEALSDTRAISDGLTAKGAPPPRLFFPRSFLLCSSFSPSTLPSPLPPSPSLPHANHTDSTGMLPIAAVVSQPRIVCGFKSGKASLKARSCESHELLPTGLEPALAGMARARAGVQLVRERG